MANSDLNALPIPALSRNHTVNSSTNIGARGGAAGFVHSYSSSSTSTSSSPNSSASSSSTSSTTSSTSSSTSSSASAFHMFRPNLNHYSAAANPAAAAAAGGSIHGSNPTSNANRNPTAQKLRRSKSFSLHPEDQTEESTAESVRMMRTGATTCHVVAINELFRNKPAAGAKSGKSFGLFTNWFSCLNPCKTTSSLDHDPPQHASMSSSSKKVAALLEISKKQQQELANKQDTIDMLEWQLEQMKSMEKQMEEDHYTAVFQELEESRKFLERATCNSDREHGKSNLSTPGDHVVKSDSRSSDMKINQSTNSDVKIISNASDIILKPDSNPQPLRCHHRHHHHHHGISNENMVSQDRTTITLSLFEMATIRARFSVRSFGKALIKQLEASGYSVRRALTELEPNVVFTRKEHVVYALESKINKAFYHCFENDNFDDSGLMQILNPMARCAARLEEFQRMKLVEVGNAVDSSHPCFSEDFWRFCERKTKELWSQFTWNIEFNSSEEREVFTASFLDAAKGVWLLHKLAYSLHPHVVILRVGKGLQIDPMYVEAVPELIDGKPCPACSQTKVEFMVVPGFQALDKVIKCQVYQHLRCYS